MQNVRHDWEKDWSRTETHWAAREKKITFFLPNLNRKELHIKDSDFTYTMHSETMTLKPIIWKNAAGWRNVPDWPRNVSPTRCLFDMLKPRLNPKRQQNKQQVKSTVYITCTLSLLKLRLILFSVICILKLVVYYVYKVPVDASVVDF